MTTAIKNARVSPLMIADHEISPGCPCFVIAEAGVNHNGSLETAKRLVDVADAAGADAVKFQTFKAEQLVTADAPKALYQQENTGSSESQLEMLRRLELDEAAHRELIAYCEAREVLFLSTAFDEASADFLASMGMPAFKIASGEITNVGLLEAVARIGRPLIMSTGMATLEEVEAAVGVVRNAGASEIVLLHCVSNYPAEPADVNLRAMSVMTETFAVPVGYSDHTPGIEVALAAVALGACVIEKHFTLDRGGKGPDHAASLEPAELKALIKGVRTVEAALGHGRKEPAASEIDTAAAARRSLVAACDIPAGSPITAAALIARRPGTGLPPTMREKVVGRVARRNISAGTVVTWDLLS